MSDAFLPNRKLIRLQNWNYAWKGLYFVTIKTKFNTSYFGDIEDNMVRLNDVGREVEKQWLMTPSVRPDVNILIDEFIVMPNHFHGIIGIGENGFNSMPDCKASRHAGPTILEPGGTFGPQIKNLGSTIRGFKSSVTSWCKSQQILFDWQSRYFDIIIRDEKMLNKIRNYIRKNPENWSKDRFNHKS